MEAVGLDGGSLGCQCRRDWPAGPDITVLDCTLNAEKDDFSMSLSTDCRLCTWQLMGGILGGET